MVSDVIRLYIAESHQVTRIGIENALADADCIQVTGHCANGLRAVEDLLALRPDVALLNINLPSLTGIEITRQLKSANADTAVLIFTAEDDVGIIGEALCAGARGCVLKQSSARQLILAIKSVAEGALWIDPLLSASFMSGYLNPAHDSTADPGSGTCSETAAGSPRKWPLSERELQVLRLVAAGSSNKQIATALAISPETVKLHIRSIVRKLQANDRSQAVEIALRDSLI